MTWPHNRPWKAVAPRPQSEDRDDALAMLDYVPNGDQRAWYNLGHGCRWVGLLRHSTTFKDDDTTRMDELIPTV